MTKKLDIRYKMSGWYEMRRLPGVVSILEAKGKAIMDAANSTLPEGEGYRMSSSQGQKGPRPPGSRGSGKGYQGRWAVRVYTASHHAKRSNARRNTLVRLLGQG